MAQRRLRILLVGYGKMGREVAACLRRRDHSVVGVVDPAVEGVAAATLEGVAREGGADVAIDFSTGEAFCDHYRHYAERGMAVVVGATGWYEHFDEVAKVFEEGGGGCVYGTNFSVGAQLFLRMVARATELWGGLEEYDFMLSEMHHRHKIDSPSGTAKSAARAIVERHPRKRAVVSEPLQRAIREDELHVVSVRGGSVPGVHTLTIDSAFDTIAISHTARTRAGFALGAVLAAEWLADKAKRGGTGDARRGDDGAGKGEAAGGDGKGDGAGKGGIYNIEDIFEEVIHAQK